MFRQPLIIMSVGVDDNGLIPATLGFLRVLCFPPVATLHGSIRDSYWISRAKNLEMSSVNKVSLV
jgi:hypothetical protein